ncbi:hypothetical protein CDAR_599531 [Caerostris darwini]|uniref:Uncharacterized protein n=1 Tax=Caerostris darwini TaxID=1538125 RepID=A0AAV4NWF2_9ARAC|nr:hypothetical protein CDAR_599531 [Caerostris darwini]
MILAIVHNVDCEVQRKRNIESLGDLQAAGGMMAWKNETSGCPCCVGVAGFSFYRIFVFFSYVGSEGGERSAVDDCV